MLIGGNVKYYSIASQTVQYDWSAKFAKTIEKIMFNQVAKIIIIIMFNEFAKKHHGVQPMVSIAKRLI